jgi:hypothetical protein
MEMVMPLLYGFGIVFGALAMVALWGALIAWDARGRRCGFGRFVLSVLAWLFDGRPIR